MWVRKEMSERGERLDASVLPWQVPSGVLNLHDTPLLAAVDPYGHTMFNRQQVERQLPGEVAFLRAELDEEWHPMLDELERLMTVASDRVHRYRWFVGD